MSRDRSNSRATPTLSKAARSRKAKQMVSIAIPEVLRASPRARHGVYKAQLHIDPQINRPETTTCPETSLCDTPARIRLRHTDALTAARQLTQSSRSTSNTSYANTPNTPLSASTNVCVLNMAASTRMGGGFLDGVAASEEFLCMRTTLYSSLWSEFYPLPQTGGVLTPDTLVLRDSSPDAQDLSKRERFYVDVISAGMLEFPGSDAARRRDMADDDAREDIENTPCSCGVSYCDDHREIVLQKMRAVLTMAQNHGSEKLVLGAWGCGPLAHPSREIAKLWRQALLAADVSATSWPGFKDVVFAIPDRAVLKDFERVFSDVLVSVAESESQSRSPDERQPLRATPSDPLTELVTKIQATEMQLAHMTSARTRTRLREKLAALNQELAHVGNEEQPCNADGSSNICDEDSAIDGYAATSDIDETSYYHFDAADIATSGSNTPASVYEFRVLDKESLTASPELVQCASIDVLGSPSLSWQQSASMQRENDDTQGWFSGSINSLSALLSKQRGGIIGNPGGSPVLSGNLDEDRFESLDLDNVRDRLALHD